MRSYCEKGLHLQEIIHSRACSLGSHSNENLNFNWIPIDTKAINTEPETYIDTFYRNIFYFFYFWGDGLPTELFPEPIIQPCSWPDICVCNNRDGSTFKKVFCIFPLPSSVFGFLSLNICVSDSNVFFFFFHQKPIALLGQSFDRYIL